MDPFSEALDQLDGKAPPPEPIVGGAGEGPFASVVASLDALGGKPEWQDERIPLPDRMNAIIFTNMKAGKKPDEAAKAASDYLGLEEGKVKPHAQLLDARRNATENMQESTWQRMAQVVPGFSTALNVGNEQKYKAARDRFNNDEATAADMDTIAQFERVEDLKRSEGTGEHVLRAVSRVPALIGEGMGASSVLGKFGLFSRGAGAAAPSVTSQIARATAPTTLKSLALAAPGYAGKTAATTALMPSMWAETASARSLAQGGSMFDLKNVAPAYGMGVLQTAVLGSLQRMSFLDKVPITAVGRAGAKGGIGMGEAAGADSIATLTDQYLNDNWKTNTRMGTLGELLRGDEGSLKRAAGQFVVFSLFAGAHAGEKPSITPLQTAIDGLAGRGFSRKNAGQYLTTIGDKYERALAENPNLTRGEVRTLFEPVQDPILREYGLSLADMRPEHAPPPQPSNADQPLLKDVEAGQNVVPYKPADALKGTAAEWAKADHDALADTVGANYLDAFRTNADEAIKKGVMTAFSGKDGSFDLARMAAYKRIFAEMGFDLGPPVVKDPRSGVTEFALTPRAGGKSPAKPPEVKSGAKPAPEPPADLTKEQIPFKNFTDQDLWDIAQFLGMKSKAQPSRSAAAKFLEANKVTEDFLDQFRPNVPPEPAKAPKTPQDEPTVQPPSPKADRPVEGPKTGSGGRPEPVEHDLFQMVKEVFPESHEGFTFFDGREIRFSVDPDRKAVVIDFRNESDTWDEQMKIGSELRKGSLVGSRKMAELLGRLHKKGLSIQYETDPRRHSVYERMLKRGGFELGSTDREGEIEPGFDRYRWDPVGGRIESQGKAAAKTATPSKLSTPTIGDAKGRFTATERAIAAARQGKAATYVDMDVDNMQGLLATTGRPAGEAHVRKMVEIIREELERSGAKVEMFNHAGDEHSAVVIGATKGVVDAALKAAEKRIGELNDAAGLSGIRHTKQGGVPGTGITTFAESVRGNQKPNDVFTNAEAGFNTKKLGGGPPARTAKDVLNDVKAAGINARRFRDEVIDDVEKAGVLDRKEWDEFVATELDGVYRPGPQSALYTELARIYADRAGREAITADQMFEINSRIAELKANRIEEGHAQVRGEAPVEEGKFKLTETDLALADARRARRQLARPTKEEVADVLEAAREAGVSAREVQGDVDRVTAEAVAEVEAEEAKASAAKRDRGRIGAATTITVAGGPPIPARYEVRELNDVRASHQALAGGALRSRVKRGEYPEGLQPRDYTRPSELEKVNRFAREMEPRYFISTHPDATSGPPTITPEGIVVNGNGRQMSIEAASFLPGKFEKYKADLVRQAKEFGLDPAVIDGMDKPALYRVVEMLPTSPEAIRFAAAGNQTTTQAQNPVRTAASLSRMIDSNLIESLRLDDDTTFSQAVMDPSKGRAFRNQLFEKLPASEVDRYFFEDKRLTDAGEELVRNMLFVKVLPVDLIERMNLEMRRVKNTIEAAVPNLLKMARDYPASDPTNQLVEAMRMYVRNPDLKSTADVDHLLAQDSLFGGKVESITPGGRMMLDFLVKYGDKSKMFRERIGRLSADTAQAEGLFGGEPEFQDKALIAAQALDVARQPGAEFGTRESAAHQAQREADAANARAAQKAGEEAFRSMMLPEVRTGPVNRVREDKIPAVVQHEDPVVESRLQKSHGLEAKSLISRIKETADAAWRGLTRAQVHLPQTAENAIANEGFRLLKTIPKTASDEANRTLAAILDPLGPKQLALFERKLLVDNQLASIDRGEPLRFGFKDRAQVEAYKARLDGLVGETPEVQRALATRESIRKELVQRAIGFKILSEDALKNDAYYHQMINSLMEVERYTGGSRPLRTKRAFEKGRVTGVEELPEEFDYNTSFVEAEARWMTELMMETRKEEILRDHFAPYDLFPSLSKQARETGIPWRQLMKGMEGYELWSPQPGNLFYKAHTVPEKLAEQLLTSELKVAGIDASDLKEALVMGGLRRPMILPEALVKQLADTQKPAAEGAVGTASRDLMGAWKAFTLLNPKRLVGYMARNLTGDIEPIIAAAPGAVRHVDRAISELRKYYTGDLAMSPELRAARDGGVIGSSLSAEEIPDVKDLPVFRRLFDKDGTSGGLLKAAGSYYEKAKTLNEFRESIGRYAAFLYYREKLMAGEPINYGGAKKSTVESLVQKLGPDVAAAHLSRNLLGDYGDLTQFGTWARRHVAPFYSWIEVNFKRWPRLATNAVKAAQQGNASAAGVMAATSIARLGALYAGVWAWNNFVKGDEEKDLSPDDRASLHINLGRNEDGSVRVFRRVGSLSDFLDWFGVNEVLKAPPQASAGDVARDVAMSPVNKAVGAVRPDVKGGFELATGQSLYPDVTRPAPKRRDEIMAGMFGLQDELKMAKGQPVKPHYQQRLLGLTQVMPGQAAVSEVRDLKKTFEKGLGKKVDRPQSPSAIAPMRDAATYDDFEAFRRAKADYVAAGGTFQKFKESLDNLDPIKGSLNEADERKFKKWLTDGQSETLARARVYVKDQQKKLQKWWWDSRSPAR